MRRQDLIVACKNILHTIKVSNIHETIKHTTIIGEKRGAEGTKEFIESLRIFSLLASRFSDNEIKVMEALQLNGLLDSSLWALLVDEERKTNLRERWIGTHRNLNQAVAYTSNFITLLEVEYLKSFSSEREGNKGRELMTVILPESDSTFSKIQRITHTLESISSFYVVCAGISGNTENDISVAGLDSGSDKSFDFVGGAKVIQMVKELIIELWDRIVFFRERKQHERIDLISKTLPILEKISDLEVAGKLSKEQSEIFKRQIVDASNKFIESGAIIPELDEHSSFSPRQLMKPEQKLLNRENNKEEEPSTQDNEKEKSKKVVRKKRNNSTENKLSKEEEALLKKLLDKMNK